MSPDGVEGNNLRSHEAALRAQAAEEKAALLQAERDRLVTDIEHLHAQLDVRAEELRRRDQAEKQLRHLMAALSQQNRVLTDMLEQKMLPPAPEPEPVRRVRWWHLWRRT